MWCFSKWCCWHFCFSHPELFQQMVFFFFHPELFLQMVLCSYQDDVSAVIMKCLNICASSKYGVSANVEYISSWWSNTHQWYSYVASLRWSVSTEEWSCGCKVLLLFNDKWMFHPYISVSSHSGGCFISMCLYLSQGYFVIVCYFFRYPVTLTCFS